MIRFIMVYVANNPNFVYTWKCRKSIRWKIGLAQQKAWTWCSAFWPDEKWKQNIFQMSMFASIESFGTHKTTKYCSNFFFRHYNKFHFMAFKIAIEFICQRKTQNAPNDELNKSFGINKMATLIFLVWNIDWANRRNEFLWIFVNRPQFGKWQLWCCRCWHQSVHFIMFCLSKMKR